MGFAHSDSQSSVNRKSNIRLLGSNELKRAVEARRTLLGFTTYTFPKYQVNWHHALISKYLDDLVFGHIERLIIKTPPRHGKSELVSRRLPAFAFGHDPDEQIILASYADSLATKMNRDTQRIMDDPSYFNVFPKTLIPRKGLLSLDGRIYLRNSEEFEIMHQKGHYKCAGIGSGITGMGFTLGLVDDPFKDRKDADSQTMRDNCWDWFTSTFMSRAEKINRVLITMTRWHEDDLVGRLIEFVKDENGDEWVILSLPACYDPDLPDNHPLDPREPGEALWPGKYNAERLGRIRHLSGSRDWSSLWQQTPIIEGGGIVKRDWWKFYREAPSRFDEIIQSWDAAFKDLSTSSYVVGQVWGRKGGDKYLLDQTRDHMSFSATVRAIDTLSAKYFEAYRKLIEDKANGPAIIDTLKNKIAGIIPVKPEGSKESRAHAVSPQIEAGNVYLPDPSIAPWVHDYIEEWAAFPHGKNDDQVDATTQALLHYGASHIAKLEQLLQ